jgi:hypothetical protein
LVVFCKGEVLDACRVFGFNLYRVGYQLWQVACVMVILFRVVGLCFGWGFVVFKWSQLLYSMPNTRFFGLWFWVGWWEYVRGWNNVCWVWWVFVLVVCGVS